MRFKINTMLKNKRLFFLGIVSVFSFFIISSNISLAIKYCRDGDTLTGTICLSSIDGSSYTPLETTGGKYTGPTDTVPPDLSGLPDPANPPGTITGHEVGNSCGPTNSTTGPKILGHYLGCDPSCPPANGGCNFQHAVKFILYLISKAYILGIALAIGMIMWAGYKIIFAGAKGEDYKEGGKIIQTALIGFAITVLASFIVQLILKIFY